MFNGVTKMMLAAGFTVALAGAGAVVLPGGQAAVQATAVQGTAVQGTAGQASCAVKPPATSPPAQCLAMTNPSAAGLAIWGVPGGPPGGTPETEWYDYLGQPIATMGQSGGFKVYGDQICVYPGGDVFTPDACLRDNGTVTVGGQALTASDIAWLHQTRGSGSGAADYIPGCTSAATTGGRGKS
jgi:hypothetical protein